MDIEEHDRQPGHFRMRLTDGKAGDLTSLTDAEARDLFRSLPLFVGFPYIVTKITAPLQHVIALPLDLLVGELTRLAWRQYLANRLPTCLVLAADRAMYVSDTGEVVFDEAPRTTLTICDRLLSSEAFPASAELVERQDRLRTFAGTHSGYLIDRARSRKPTPEELWRLAGRNEEGVPKGLVRCPGCHGWRGESLVGSPDRVVRVFCRCEDHNRCARCLELLYERRLDGCGYFEDERKVLHVAGFSGLGHRCP